MESCISTQCLDLLSFSLLFSLSGDSLVLMLAKEDAIQEWQDIMGPANPSQVKKIIIVVSNVVLCGFV